MTPDQIVFFVKQYGFPIVSSVGMGYFVYFIYRFVTLKLMPVIGETNGILVSLIDRIRMLDNDMIRLQQKVSVLLQMQDEENVRKNQVRDPKNSKS
jgi:hypothetical protein